MEGLAAVHVAVGREQHLRLNLPEAIQHAVYTEVRRAGSPDGPEARRGKHGDERFGEVGKEAGDPIVLLNSQRRQPGGNPGDLRVQLAEGQLATLVFLVAKQNSGPIVAIAQQVLGEVQARAGEEARSGHLAGVLQVRSGAPIDADVGEACQLLPEVRRMLQRPAVQVRVAVELRAASGIDAVHEPREVGSSHSGRGRAPDFAHRTTAPDSWARTLLPEWSS